jgi:hypothetical protein
VGWGVLYQVGQEYPAVLDQDPEWSQEVAEKLYDLGITWMGLGVYAGTLRNDADYWLAWFNAGAGSGPERDEFDVHRHHVIDDSDFYSREEHHIRMINRFRQVAGADFRWYVKINQYDLTDPPPSGATTLSGAPVLYGSIIKKLWDWRATNWPALGEPHALDVENETQFSNTWNAAKVAAAALETRSQLATAGYAEPIWFAASWQDPDFMTATNADALWLTLLQSKLQLSSHLYGASSSPDPITGKLASLALMDATSENRGGGWINTESPGKPLTNALMLAYGRCVGMMNFGAADPFATHNSLLFFDATDPVGSQVTEQPNTRCNKYFFQTIRPGDARIESTPSNLDVATDEAAAVMYADGSTGRIKGVAVTNKVQAVWVKVPAGRYRVTKILASYATATSLAGDPTITAEDEVGVTYDVTAGEGIHLNEHDSDAAGVFAFVQEA